MPVRALGSSPRRAAHPAAVALLALALLLTTAAALASPAHAATHAATHDATGHASAHATTHGPQAAARAAHAVRALEHARAVLAPKPHPAAALGHGRDATLALTRLARLRGSLTGTDRAEAARLLARPTDGDSDPQGTGYAPGTVPRVDCSATTCVHWVETTEDAPDLTDTDGNAIPDYVDLTLSLVDQIRATYVAAGYRAPEPDQGIDGNDLTDIYLAEVGSAGLYGYCTSDKQFDTSGLYDGWAYCVFDNDYAGFPQHTPTQNLEVTAAHEYFHAVQFAYDAFEDGWFMEATATWAEDEVFDDVDDVDDVDDNVQYLPAGPLGQPGTPLDAFTGLHQDGDWIFFRYLTEQMPTAQGGLPTLVRDVWRRADGSAGAADEYSLQALASELTARGTTLRSAFAHFAEANRRPATTYAEGAANAYPRAPVAGTFPLSSAHRDTGWKYLDLDHLTSAIARFVPTRLTSSGWRLRVRVDLPPTARGSTALATVYGRSGSVTVKTVSLDSQGDGSLAVPFRSGQVSAVEVTLVDASARFSCWRGSPYSCSGQPRDDGLRFEVRGTAVR